MGPRVSRVLEAADGLTALRLARSGVVDMVISDVEIDLDGFEGRAASPGDGRRPRDEHRPGAIPTPAQLTR